MSKFRKPTHLEEVTAWRQLAWDLNLHRTLTLDASAVHGILARTDKYVESHSDSNGLKLDPEVNQQVWGAFWTHIANDAETGLKKREA